MLALLLLDTLSFTLLMVDPYGIEGIYSDQQAEIVHDFSVLLMIVLGVRGIYFFAHIMSRYHPPTKRVLAALKVRIHFFVCVCGCVQV